MNTLRVFVCLFLILKFLAIWLVSTLAERQVEVTALGKATVHLGALFCHQERGYRTPNK